MRAVYYDQFRKPPVITTLPDPITADGGVVIKVEVTGLCRSDFHGWTGHGSDIHLPHVLGRAAALTLYCI
jgi:alcohol dehydrogenase